MAINKIDPSEYKNLTPFKLWLVNQINTWGFNNFPFLENDFDQLTNYGMMMKLMKAVDSVINNENVVEEDIGRIYEAFGKLVDYVDQYFDTNFPQLVNDKLDEMASDGTLSNLLNNYAGLIKVYDTFIDLVADTTLSNGQKVKTLGYYSINDNGGAEYYITTSEPQSGYYEEISTGIYASILLNDRINFKQLGAKTYEEDSTFDNKNIIDKYVSICNAYDKTFELFIPGGRWCFSATLINRPKGVRIVGDKTWAYDDIYGSAIIPLNDNQQYVWKLGGLQDYTDYSTSITVGQMVKSCFIDGLCFSTINGAADTRYSVSQGTFIIDRCEFCTFDNLYFWRIKGNGLVITSSWELDFGILSIRQHQNPLTYSLLFDRSKPVDGVSVNISALTINNLYFERNDNYIRSMAGSGFSHNHINYINVETKFTSVTNTWITTTATPEEIAEATEVHIFRGFCRFFTIGTMNIVFNDSNRGIIYDDTNKYYMKSVICDDYSLISGISARDRQFNIDISQITVLYGTTNSEMSIIKSRNMAQLAHIHIGSLSCEDNNPKILIDAYQSGNIRIGSFSGPTNAYNTSDIVTDFIPAYKHTSTMTTSGLVTYMENAPSEYHLVSFKESTTNATGIRFTYYGISDSTNTQTLKILCKNLSENDITFKVRFIHNGSNSDTTSPTLPADGEWHILSMTFWADFGSNINFLDYGGNKAIAGFKIE